MEKVKSLSTYDFDQKFRFIAELKSVYNLFSLVFS